MSGLPITSIAQITGPMLLGHLFNYALMGALGIQVYVYTLSFRKDRPAIKALVYSLLFIDIMQTCLASHYAWYVLASGWGNPLVLRFTPWTLATIPPLAGSIAFIVQLFFAWRIWMLGMQRKLYIPIVAVIVLTSTMSCIAAFYSGILSAKLRDVARASELDPSVTAWLAGSMVCDILITITLVLQLASRRNKGFGGLNNVLHRAIRVAIETGAVTSVVVIIELVLFLQSDLTSWYFMLGMVIGKLYSNSLLANLNSRSPSFRGGNAGENSTGAHVWQIGQIDVSVNTTTTTTATIPERSRRQNDIELSKVQELSHSDTFHTRDTEVEDQDYHAYPAWK